jgi:hypothetical protein
MSSASTTTTPSSSQSVQSNQSAKHQVRSATPFSKRVSSNRLPDDDSLKDVEDLALMLQQDFDDLEVSSTLEDDLVELLHKDYGVFPDSVLPFPINRDLLQKLPPTVYNSSSRTWKMPSKFTEKVMLYVFLWEIRSDRKCGIDHQSVLK